VEIVIEGIAIHLLPEANNVRVTTDSREVILFAQEVGAIAALIKDNFELVVSHYRKMIERVQEKFNDEDIREIGLMVVLNYLYMYCMWRIQYKQYQDKDLQFDPKDLDHPSTHDAIFFYLKSKRPKTWREQSAILLGMDAGEFDKYYNGREDYYNK